MSFLNNIVHAAGKVVGTPLHLALTVTLAPEKLLAKELAKVPVIGKPLAAVVNLGSAPERLMDRVAQGDRLDHAVIANFRISVPLTRLLTSSLTRSL